MRTNNRSGHMPDVFEKTCNPFNGKCYFDCVWCTTKCNVRVRDRYTGPVRCSESYFNGKSNDNKPKTVLVGNCMDNYACDVPDSFIERSLAHLNKFPRNTYAILTKNPGRVSKFLHQLPPNTCIGTTIETNRSLRAYTKAPEPIKRYRDMKKLNQLLRKFKLPIKTFLMLEPLMDFDLEVLARWVHELEPAFIHIGANSRQSVIRLPEPSKTKIKALMKMIEDDSIIVRTHTNIARILG